MEGTVAMSLSRMTQDMLSNLACVVGWICENVNASSNQFDVSGPFSWSNSLTFQNDGICSCLGSTSIFSWLGGQKVSFLGGQLAVNLPDGV